MKTSRKRKLRKSSAPRTLVLPAEKKSKPSKLDRERSKLADPVAGEEYLRSLRKRFMIGVLRRASMRWPPKGIALQDARIAPGVYRCASCKGEFRAKDIRMDHEEPIIDPKTGFTTWEDYTVRMFCPVKGYQALCEPCHDVKTASEDQGRRPKKKRL